MAKKPLAGQDRMRVRTYGVWPTGSWPQVQPARIASLRVTPEYGSGHWSGAVPAEFEIVYEMQGDPNEAGARHALILNTDQAHRLLSLLTPALKVLGSSGSQLRLDEPVVVGERVRISGYKGDDRS